jgi:hypothetical protein
MRIKEITFRHRNDYQAILKCEFCGHEQFMGDGYADLFFVTKVIPARRCHACGRSAVPWEDAGSTQSEPERSGDG